MIDWVGMIIDLSDWWHWACMVWCLASYPRWKDAHDYVLIYLMYTCFSASCWDFPIHTSWYAHIDICPNHWAWYMWLWDAIAVLYGGFLLSGSQTGSRCSPARRIGSGDDRSGGIGERRPWMRPRDRMKIPDLLGKRPGLQRSGWHGWYSMIVWCTLLHVLPWLDIPV